MTAPKRKTALHGGRCPVSGNGLDPAAVPLPVAILLPTSFLLWGLAIFFSSPSMTDGQEQIFHGVLMHLFAYPLGLCIPHAKIKKAMALAHGASLLQGTILVVCGMAWHETFGFVDGTSYSLWTKYINLYGMWGNTFGILWGAIMGASDLFYVTKESLDHRGPDWIENILHGVLKSQGLCNIISCVMIIKQFVSTIEDKM
jgi:hypothetical protein